MKKKDLKPIPGFPGYFATKTGEIYSTQKWRGVRECRKLKLHKDDDGHFVVSIYRNRRPYWRYVHRLILETFVGPRPEGMCCCHGPNGNLDNSLANLEWGTRSKNNGEDRSRDGTDNRGEKHGKAKLTAKDIPVIRMMYPRYKLAVIAKIFGIDKSSAGYIVRRKRWAWLA